MKKLSEKLWLKLKNKHLYEKLNTFNKKLYKMHLELLKIFFFIEIEEMLHRFVEEYVNRH